MSTSCFTNGTLCFPVCLCQIRSAPREVQFMKDVTTVLAAA